MSALHEAAEYVDLSGLSAPRRRPTEFDPERSVADQVGEWLDEAGLTLATLRMKNLRPSGVRINWPDIVMDRDDLAWARMSDELLPPPTADAIVRMDRALCWVMLLDDRTQKIVVNKRLIVHPVSGKFLWEWRKLGKLLGMNHETAKVRWREACEVIGKKMKVM